VSRACPPSPLARRGASGAWHNRFVEILRVLNNNVVLARDEIGREAILTGRGLGF